MTRSRASICVEELHGAHDFEIHQRGAVGRLRRAAQRELAEPEPGARDLPVIGGRMLRGGLIVRARLAVASRRLGGAALPVFAARERDRVRGAVADAGEMLVGGVRIVGEAQRDPAGGELVLGAMDCPSSAAAASRATR